MGKKNWIEFDNQEKKSEEVAKVNTCLLYTSDAADDW